ncbi:MAG: peptide deformylase [Xanthomonadales bacterium]|nr:peptide deformylase [Xanthomonadales bacterium]
MSESLPSLVNYGQPTLMRVQDPVSDSDIAADAFQQRLQVLRHCMIAYQGIGIAAPQVGWNARVFCMGIEDSSDRYPGADRVPFAFWINPRITAASGRNWAWEGCLSVPGMRGWIARPSTIEVSGLDHRGQTVQCRLDGFAARVFQHEYDHLDGVLFPMRVSHSRFLVPELALVERSSWNDDWPSVGSRKTEPGQLSPQE